MIGNFFERYRDFIPEYELFLDSLKSALPTYLRLNPLKIDPLHLIERLQAKGIILEIIPNTNSTLLLTPELNSPGNLVEYFLGYVHPQALTSSLVSLALSPRPGSLVLDMCASPGGKTSHMAHLMNNTGLIVGNELFKDRLIPLSHTLSRLGVLNTIVTTYQAQEFPLRERFDYVLADVPCSGEGRLRAYMKYSKYRGDKGESLMTELQKRIILRGFDLLHEDGVMVYGTCTYNPRENEAIVDYLLNERNAELLPINLAFKSEPGLTGWKGEQYDKRMEKAVRFYPHRIDSVGFFMAKIGRPR